MSNKCDALIDCKRRSGFSLKGLQSLIGRYIESSLARIDIHQEVGGPIWDLEAANRPKTVGFDGVHIYKAAVAFDYHQGHCRLCWHHFVLNYNDKRNVAIPFFGIESGESVNSQS